MKFPKMQELDPYRRDLMFRVMDGQADLAVLLWHLNHYRECERMLDWLIANHLTGLNLMHWWLGDHKGSPLSVGKSVLAKLEKSRELRSVLVGRDYLPN